ncbi:hypothetical protein BJ322DRAFT_782699 [Thelephora terrestris]|uniref:Uncharacterized protein n=1 Tax=Thelephora terrestris TaxID=56493 RepID=A0A9P6L856_9AGAM|nr:hypothetical protein BJ322DRAFT_782699 [Thelephora terrestris]
MDPDINSHPLDNLLHSTSARTLQYERQLKELESKLSEHLSNSRTIDTSLRQVYAGIQRNVRRTDRAIDVYVPHINRAFDDALKSLSQLESTLPVTRAQIAEIRSVYDSGRVKAQDMVKDMTWLTTSFYDRWRMIIFTSSAPVSARTKFLVRCLFALCFVACNYIVYISAMGAYKAHRHRFIWGDKIMS